ncbi:MAG TPA: HesA/MoeB/ThiF family protein [Steroidobacteraceae bacterium]|nr:HesA/MoeB/ThiF family protein [Steroidobacteraceae bacterium]
MNDVWHRRYTRQIALPEIGAEGQQRLANASVVVVGAGGLGCAVLPYLCGAGVGRLTILDPDRVEESNLYRQPLYRVRDLGDWKVRAARTALLETNPHAHVDAIGESLTPGNVMRHVACADIVVDAADSFAVTYMLSDECHRVRKVLVSASVIGLSGYVGAFCGGAPSYRAVFPELPAQAANCAQAGVLGTAVGVIGTLQAHMTLAVILRLKPSVLGQVLSVDFQGLRFGGFRFDRAGEPACATMLRFIAAAALEPEDVIVDLRTDAEIAAAPLAATRRMTVDEIERGAVALERERRVVLCCRSGLRAWRAARALQKQGYEQLALVALGVS